MTMTWSSSVVVVSYEYGSGFGAEGICTERLVHALREKDVQVAVVASRSGVLGGRAGLVRHAPSFLSRPTRLQKRVGQLLVRGPVEHWAWVLAAAASPVPEGAVVYGRGNPLASLVAAARLARRNRAPLWLHFSDPIPSPWDGAHDDATATTVRALLLQATGCTFTAPEAIPYMEQVHGLELRSRSAVLRNIVPGWQTPFPDEGPTLDIVYVGTFGGRRLPDELIDGLAIASKVAPRPLRLVLVGTTAPWIARIRARAGRSVQIVAVPRTPEVQEHYARCAVACCVDAPESSVFLATKTGEAIHAARRVLLVSPAVSPATTLFARRWESVAVTPHDPAQIARALLVLASLDESVWMRELAERRAALASFRSHEVAAVFRDSVLRAADERGRLRRA
jgi:hypothetical protein